MKSIGGFFELEIAKGSSLYHDDALAFSTGRACVSYILELTHPSKIYLPYYCCDALFEPMVANGVPYEFYGINEKLEIQAPPELKKNEFIIYTDFFGIKKKYIKTLINKYADKLIVDNTHSFFEKDYKTGNFSFTSARKYFGVPDGAFMYPSTTNNIKLSRNKNISVEHGLHRLIGLDKKAFEEYKAYEKSLNSEIKLISYFSEKTLATLDFKNIRQIRIQNFNFFLHHFKNINCLNIDKNVQDCFCYPLLLDNPINRKKLYEKKIFIPNLWIDTLKRDNKDFFPFECKLSEELLPLPIDHRYRVKDLKAVVSIIKDLTNEQRLLD